MNWSRIAVLGVFALAGPPEMARAQSNPLERENPCDLAEAPFPLTDANRLDDRRLAERFLGKTFTVQRRLLQNLPPPKKRPFERVMTFNFRTDHSLRIICRQRRSPGSDLMPCPGFGPSDTRGEANSTDIAIWRINRGRICMQRSKNDRELCVYVHEADGRGYARLDGGRRASCLEGEISFP
jgi:hypothetical protein